MESNTGVSYCGLESCQGLHWLTREVLEVILKKTRQWGWREGPRLPVFRCIWRFSHLSLCINHVFCFLHLMPWPCWPWRDSLLRVIQFLGMGNNSPSSLPFKCKPTNPELTILPPPSLGSHSGPHYPRQRVTASIPQPWACCFPQKPQ